ncbi:flavodoxin domain-containing protein [Streptomyces sp. NPDC059070]|uniref:flavodoxin domain-containing protein n=1 Tax=unclassified Streptomyces TaxID=2593676 RepID=UPI0034E1E746
MTGMVLVAYGTTNGSTKEIAETVSDVLLKGGLTAQVLAASTVTSIAPYDAVVLGGALYAGRWHKDARRFVRHHRALLAGCPVWFFSSGPLDASASEKDLPPVSGVQRAMTRLGVRGHVTFGGCLREGAKGRMATMILRSGKGGDFRDFDAIKEWAGTISRDLSRG